MSATRKRIPSFRSEDEERSFWAAPERDSTEYLDWSQGRPAPFPNLSSTTRTISLRLPVGLLEQIKAEAEKRDMTYQALIAVWLLEKAERKWRA